MSLRAARTQKIVLCVVIRAAERGRVCTHGGGGGDASGDDGGVIGASETPPLSMFCIITPFHILPPLTRTAV